MLIAFGCARPRPVLRPADESRAQRSTLDVVTGLQEVPRSIEAFNLRLVKGTRMESTRSPNAFESGVVGSGYPAQELCQTVRPRRTNDEVPVVRHDAVRNQSHGMTAQPTIQNRKKRTVIGRSEKHGLAARRVTDHMKETRADVRSPRFQHGAVSFRNSDVPRLSKEGAARDGNAELRSRDPI